MSQSIRDTTELDLAKLPALLNDLATPSPWSDSFNESLARMLADLAGLALRVLNAQQIIVVPLKNHQLDSESGTHILSISVAQTPSHEPTKANRVQLIPCDAIESESASVGTAIELAQSASREERTQLTDHEGATWIATTVTLADQSFAIVSRLWLGHAGPEPFVAMQQWLTMAISLWHARWQSHTARHHQSRLEHRVALIEAVERSRDFRSAAIAAVDAIAIACDAHQVALVVGGSDWSKRRLDVVAIGGQGKPLAERIWQAAAGEAMLRGRTTRWPAGNASDAAATIAHRELAQSVSTQHQAISVPIQSDGWTGIWIAVIERDHQMEPELLEQLGRCVWPTLARRFETDRPLVTRMIASTQRTFSNRRNIGFTLLAVLLISLIPIPYRVSGTATLVPQIRQYVVAPHQDIVKSVKVTSGDVVHRGDTIVELDGRELQLELASLIAQCEQAAKRRDIERAAGNVAAEQLAQYELETAAANLELTQRRLDQLVIESPLDGVVLTDHLEGARGAPVETGQMLAEIASLDRLWIEVFVPEEELSQIAIGQTLRVGFDSFDNHPMDAIVESISPATRVHEGQNVFVVRAGIHNPSGQLRPGIRGVAKIDSHRRSLIAVLTRHVWRRLCRIGI